MDERLEAMARFMWEARTARRRFENLPPELEPASPAEAYAAQERFLGLAEPRFGRPAGAKIATTTKVMQELMGIAHPCAGVILERTVHASPARIASGDFVNLRIESEIALRLADDLPAAGAPWTAATVAPCVGGAMPAYELIEDRHAQYTRTRAVSLIVENCWNAGVVLGEPRRIEAGDVRGILGRQSINGRAAGEGRAEDPFATLAWLANTLAERGRSLAAGMVVITGSLIPTFSVAAGDHLVFAVQGLGEVVLDIV